MRQQGIYILRWSIQLRNILLRQRVQTYKSSVAAPMYSHLTLRRILRLEGAPAKALKRSDGLGLIGCLQADI